MRPAYRVLRAVAALGASAALLMPVFSGPAAAVDETVLVGEGNENRFTPGTVRIKPGDTVTWQYAGGLNHTVTSTTANWSKNDPVGPPTTISFETSYLFDRAGTYRYVCSTHEDNGMKGTVIVEGRSVRPSPTPTRTTARPSSPPPSGTTAPPPSGSESPSVTPSASAGSATPAIPSGSVAPPASTTPPPTPNVAPTVENTYLGEGGLTPHPATGRGKGLPVMLALLLIGGVGSAELRALLAVAPE